MTTTTIKLTRSQWNALWDCVTRGGDLRHDETPTPRPVRLKLADSGGTIDLSDPALVAEALDWLGEVADRTEMYPPQTRAAAGRAAAAIHEASHRLHAPATTIETAAGITRGAADCWRFAAPSMRTARLAAHCAALLGYAAAIAHRHGDHGLHAWAWRCAEACGAMVD